MDGKMTPRELCEYIANDKAFEDTHIKALAKEALSENEKELARWYEKGRESVKRKNQSGCCCIIDDNDQVVSVCGAHLTWLEEHGGSVTSQS